MNKIIPNIARPLIVASALCFTACGEKSESSDASQAFEYPEAPDAAIKMVFNEMAEANGVVLWQAMPAGYQEDVTSIVHLAGTKVDAEIYNQIFSTVDQLAKALDKQKDFVFKTKLMGEPSEEQITELRKSWPSIMKLIQTLTSSSLASAEGLQQFDGKSFFSGTVSTLLTDIEALVQLSPESEEAILSELGNVQVNLLESTETTAILEMLLPGEEPQTQTFVKVEERWVPMELADQWEGEIARSRAQLEAIDPAKIAEQKPQIMSVFGMIDGVIAQVDAAETQAQFDQALQGAMMPMMGLMMMGQGMGGSGAGAPSMPVTPATPEMPPVPKQP